MAQHSVGSFPCTVHKNFHSLVAIITGQFFCVHSVPKKLSKLDISVKIRSKFSYRTIFYMIGVDGTESSKYLSRDDGCKTSMYSLIIA